MGMGSSTVLFNYASKNVEEEIMDTYDLLKEDLVQVAIQQHTRMETELLAGRLVDLIADMAKEIAEKAVEEHTTDYFHTMRGDY